MATINNPNCIVLNSNTGVGNCKLFPKHIKGAVLLPKNKVLTDAEALDLKTTLRALFIQTNLLRAFPVIEFVGFKDSSKKTTFGSLGYGKELPVKQGDYMWDFDLANGICFSNKLKAFNPPNNFYDALFVDADNNFWGTKSINATTGAVEIKGFSLDYIFTDDFELTDGSKPAVSMVRFALKDAKEFNQDVAYIPASKVNIKLNELKGMFDLVLTKQAAIANKVTVGVNTLCDGIDLYSLYADALASASLWIVKNASTGAAITTTTCVKNATTGGWDVGFTGTGISVTITLTTPALLATAGIGGLPDNYFESNTITVAVP